MNRIKGLVAMAALSAIATAASAQELRIGTQTETTSLDPHWQNAAGNNEVSRDIYDSLIGIGPNFELLPGLALSWRAVDDLTWEFKLRPGVKFQDGSPLSADDVLCSFKRAQTAPGSSGAPGFGGLAVGKTLTKVDDLTVRMTTQAPYPLMPNDVAPILIVSQKSGCNASTPDFNSGKTAIGTGPFKLIEYRPGDHITLARNDDYWGPRAAWAKVTIRPIAADGPRVAALLAGDVDLINGVPSTDVSRLKANSAVSVFQIPTTFVIFLGLDQFRANSPGVKGNDGQPIKNPLLDRRVRLAISKAIDRIAIRERVMDGQSVPAGQIVPPGVFGYDEKLEPEAFDPDGAKKLLEDAGYAKGFHLTLAGTNDRYLNDAAVLQAVAQMLTKVGITTDVEAVPFGSFSTRRAVTKPSDFSFFMSGRGTSTGEASSSLRPEVATFSAATGYGTSNSGGYSNPDFDALLAQALVTVDDRAREALLKKATELAISDQAIIPLHYQIFSWAARKGITFIPYVNQNTLAIAASPIH